MSKVDCLVTIAGTDPSGGAGIQVDLQVFRDYGHHGASVVTSVVCQNTQGVCRFEPVGAQLLECQLEAVFDDLAVGAVKIGMLGSPEIATTVGAFLESEISSGTPVVVDPVLASGVDRSSLGKPGVVEAICEFVAPAADLVTPNRAETEHLLGTELNPGGDWSHVGADLRRKLGSDSLIKGIEVGDRAGDDREVTDLLVTEASEVFLEPLTAVDSDPRGTGCQLSSAIAAELCSRAGGALRGPIDAARSYLNAKLRSDVVSVGEGRPVVFRGGP